MAETNQGETTRLLPSEHSVLAATGNMGRIYRLGEGPGAAGSYEAPVHDSGTASRWGSLSWRGEMPAGCSLTFHTRSGQFRQARPHLVATGPRRSPLPPARASPVPTPATFSGRWKWPAAAAMTPVVNSVTLAYLPQNSPPVVRNINVVTQAVAVTTPAKPTTGAATGAYTVTVTDSGDASASSSGGSTGSSTETLPRASQQQITINWQADDPDGDKLIYNVYFRSEDESQWLLLRSGLHDNSITFDADILADGKYFFRVLASDREANSPASAREAQLTSAPVLIDNTPPAVTIATVRYSGGNAHVEFEAVDAASALRHCEYALDAATWVPVDAADGVIDSLREKFVLDLTGVAPGEHLLVIRVADSANNFGLAKVLLK